MREIVKANQPFVRSEMSMDEAKELFADQPYKVEIIERVEAAEADVDDAGEVGEGGVISAYRNTDEFVDMCVGPHVPSTGRLGLLQAADVSRAPTGAATRRARCCSASTARPGSRSRRSPSTSTSSRRPPSATTASWRPNSTCSASRTSWAVASPSGTRRARSSAS